MNRCELEKWKHGHDFSLKNEEGEKQIFYVLLLTSITMVVEVIAGTVYGSMALLADGWHMATHVAAFMITLFAYRYARKHANSSLYTFGTGKVSVLGGFSSAVALAVVALMMVIESLERLLNPHPIQFNEALIVAGIGFFINLLSVFLLQNSHKHVHLQDGDHPHEHHHDHNLKAAYFHVLADILTSLLAILALFLGKYFGWNWFDPIMGIVGAVIITRWSFGLLKQTGPILLDASIDEKYRLAVIKAIEDDSDNRVADAHIWKVSEHHYAAVISVVTHFPKDIEYYKGLLRQFEKISHITIEIKQCKEMPCVSSEDEKV